VNINSDEHPVWSTAIIACTSLVELPTRWLFPPRLLPLFTPPFSPIVFPSLQWRSLLRSPRSSDAAIALCEKANRKRHARAPTDIPNLFFNLWQSFFCLSSFFYTSFRVRICCVSVFPWQCSKSMICSLETFLSTDDASERGHHREFGMYGIRTDRGSLEIMNRKYSRVDEAKIIATEILHIFFSAYSTAGT
jgi:hypothetical protein